MRPIVYKPLQMQNQNRWQRLDVRLAGHRASRTIPVGDKGVRHGEVAEGISDGAGMGVLDVELEWAVGFEGYAVFVAWFTEDGAEVSGEDSCDGGFHDNLLQRSNKAEQAKREWGGYSSGGGDFLTTTDFFPAVFAVDAVYPDMCVFDIDIPVPYLNLVMIV